MSDWLPSLIESLLSTLALPRVGLPAIFIVSLVSATLLPLASEPAVFAYVKLVPDMFWPAVLVATLGNSIGGVISYWTGYAAHSAYVRMKARHDARHPHPPKEPQESRWHAMAQKMLSRFGAKTLLMSWLPLVGDPMCAAAGWLRLDLKACTVYMTIGKFVRYAGMTAFLIWVTPSSWLLF
jgi:membrane protein YqaA with SNARE-associated domain